MNVERKTVRLPRVVWVPGIQYEGETKAQMQAREERLRVMDAEIDEIEGKAEAARARPWWEEP